jgi:hypothetical protein
MLHGHPRSVHNCGGCGKRKAWKGGQRCGDRTGLELGPVRRKARDAAGQRARTTTAGSSGCGSERRSDCYCGGSSSNPHRKRWRPPTHCRARATGLTGPGDRPMRTCPPSFHDPCHPGPSDGSVPSHRAMRRQSFVLPPPDENRAAHPRDAAPDRVVDPRRPRHKNVVDARPVKPWLGGGSDSGSGCTAAAGASSLVLTPVCIGIPTRSPTSRQRVTARPVAPAEAAVKPHGQTFRTAPPWSIHAD